MPIETSVTIIALAFVVLVIFLVTTLMKTKETLAEAAQLIQKLDELTSDIKSKSESLNFLFPHPRRETNDTMKEVVELMKVSLHLFDKIKTAVRHYAK